MTVWCTLELINHAKSLSRSVLRVVCHGAFLPYFSLPTSLNVLSSLWFFGGFHLLHKRQSFDKRQQQKLKKIRPHQTTVQSCTVYNWSLFLDHFILFLEALPIWENRICYLYSFDDSSRSSKSIIEIHPILGCNQNMFHRPAKQKIGENFSLLLLKSNYAYNFGTKMLSFTYFTLI